MANQVAPGVKNVLRAQSLRMCAINFKVPRLEPKSPRASSEQWLSGVTFEILEKAYVVLIPIANTDSSVSPGAIEPILARTTANGLLVWIEQSEIDGEPPSDLSRTMWFEPGWSFACFWTRHAAIATQVWKDVLAMPAEAIHRHPFDTFETGPRERGAPFGDLKIDDISRSKLEVLVSDKQGRLKARRVHGVFPGRVLQALQVGSADARADYIFARSHALTATYIARLLEFLAADVRRTSSASWLTLEGARGLVEHGIDGVRLKELDEDLHSLQVGNAKFKAGEWNEKFATYAYDCAKSKVSREQFWQALNMRVTDDSWREAATEIWHSHHIAHPAYEGDRVRLDQFPNVIPILHYFDFYAFSFRHSEAPWVFSMDSAKKGFERTTTQLSELGHRLLTSAAPYERFLSELGAHLRDGAPERIDLHTLYLGTALHARFKWWDDFEIEKEETWARVRLYTTWISTLDIKLGDLMKRHFGDPEAAGLYNHFLEESVENFERFFKKLADFDARFAGKTIKRKYGNVTIEADFSRNTFVVHAPGEAIEELGPIRFLVEKKTLTQEVRIELPRRKSGGMKRRFGKATRQTTVGRAFVPDIPFKAIHNWPLWLSAFGNTVALGVIIAQSADRWRHGERVDVVGKIAMGTFQSVDSVGAAINTILRRSSKIIDVMKSVGFVGNAMEAFFNVKEGAVLIFDSEDSEVVRALERGDEVEAALKMIKGWVLISTTVPGAVLFASAAMGKLLSFEILAALDVGAVAAGPALVVGLAVGAIIVVGIDAFIYAYSGPDDIMESTDESLRDAVRKEFGESMDGECGTLRHTVRLLHDIDHALTAIQ